MILVVTEMYFNMFDFGIQYHIALPSPEHLIFPDNGYCKAV